MLKIAITMMKSSLSLNMVEQGVFGDLTHAECAYIHDLRKHLLDEHYEGHFIKTPSR